MLASHLSTLGPLPLTTATRLVFDLAAYVHPAKLERTIDDALAKRLTNPRALHETLKVLAARGRPGITAMRAALEERPIGYRPPESHLEARVQSILRSAGFVNFERQVDVGDDDGWVARVDFLDRSTSVILQVDGDRWHSAASDVAHDRAQDERLERAGYHVLRVTESQVWMRSHEIVDAVLAATRERSAA